MQNTAPCRLVSLLSVTLALVLSSAALSQPTVPPATPKPGTVQPLITAPASTPAPEQLPQATNAALFYWRAWAYEPPQLIEAINKEFNGRDPAWVPSVDAGKALDEAQGFILSIVRAAEFPECDFQLEYTLGRDLVLPHLDKARASARLLVSDTRRLQAAGSIDDAVRRVTTLYSMAAHFRNDRLTHSSAMAQGFARMAADEVARFVAAKVLTDAHRAQLKKAIAPIAGDDPFYFASAIRREGAISYHFLTSRFAGATAGSDLLQAIAVGGEPEETASAISAMDAAGVKAGATQALAYFTQVADLWNQPDPVERLRALELKVVGSEFGPIALLVCPGLSPAYEGSKAQLAVIRAAGVLLDPPSPR